MPGVCLVIPCYNEARRLKPDAVRAFVDAHDGCSLLFVDDGSRDGTADVLEALRASRPDRCDVLILEANHGKAEAVRLGMLHATAAGVHEAVGYWDADMSTPLGTVTALLDSLRLDPARVLAMGSRWKHLGSRIERRAVRHALGRIFATAAGLLLGLPVYDSQCGAKLFRPAVVPDVFGRPFVTRWLFDVEILARLIERLGREEVLHRVVEVPLAAWTDVPGSKLRVTHMLAVPLELARIRRAYLRDA